MFTSSNTINSIITVITANQNNLVRGFAPDSNILLFAEDEHCYKAMLFLDRNGNFIPAVTFRYPTEGKRVIHTVTDCGRSHISCVKQENEWIPTHGVSILWVQPNGTLKYACAPLTEWEQAHGLSFLSSFGWLKGENAYDTIAKLGCFAELNKGVSIAEAGCWEDEAIGSITRQEWFRNAYRDAMGMKTPVAQKKQKVIVDASAFKQSDN